MIVPILLTYLFLFNADLKPALASYVPRLYHSSGGDVTSHLSKRTLNPNITTAQSRYDVSRPKREIGIHIKWTDMPLIPENIKDCIDEGYREFEQYPLYAEVRHWFGPNDTVLDHLTSGRAIIGSADLWASMTANFPDDVTWADMKSVLTLIKASYIDHYEVSMEARGFIRGSQFVSVHMDSRFPVPPEEVASAKKRRLTLGKDG